MVSLINKIKNYWLGIFFTLLHMELNKNSQFAVECFASSSRRDLVKRAEMRQNDCVPVSQQPASSPSQQPRALISYMKKKKI